MRNRRRNIMSVWVAVIVAMLFFSACSGGRGKVAGNIMPEGLILREGDVVLRCGGGLTSHAVMLADNNGAYSHVGIVVDSGGTKMIVHAVPDEPDFEGDVDRVKMDSLGRFFSSVYADKGEVLRHKDARVAARAAHYALAIYHRKTLFDHDYDEKDTTKMCCTELITFSFARVGQPLQGVERHQLSVPGMQTDCVLPSDILKCKDFQSIIKF